MSAEGISVLLVEQNARMSLEIADDAYVLDDGIVVYSGTARELAADEARVRALAGASAEDGRSPERGALAARLSGRAHFRHPREKRDPVLQLFGSIPDVSEYWVARFRGR